MLQHRECGDLASHAIEVHQQDCRPHLDGDRIIVCWLRQWQVGMQKECGSSFALSENHTTRPITQVDTYRIDREG
jgi:hypothetical protein